MTSTNEITDTYTFNGKDYPAGVIDFSNLTNEFQIQQLDSQGFNYTYCTCDKVYSIKFANGAPDTSRLNADNPFYRSLWLNYS